MMKNKRGAAEQVDWAMSLAIFLFLVVWFFLIIKPFSAGESKVDLVLDKLRYGFNREVLFEIKTLPVYIDYNITISNAPIIIDKPHNWTNFTINEGTFFINDGNKLIFMADIKEGSNLVMMKTSEKNYSESFQPGYVRELGNNVYVDSRQYFAGFSDNLLRTVFFRSSSQIENITYYLEGEKTEHNLSEKTTSYLYVKHNNSNAVFTQENYVFKDNSFVFDRITPRPYLSKDYTYKVLFRLDKDYLKYNLGSGMQNLAECTDFESNLAMFTDNTNSITFSFNKEVSMSACPYSNRIDFYFETPLSSTLEYSINSNNGTLISYDGDVLRERNYRIGIIKTTSGISYTKLQAMEEDEISMLKERLNITREVDFEIEVYNASRDLIFSIHTYEPYVENIFTKQYRNYLIDRYGNQQLVFVNLKTW